MHNITEGAELIPGAPGLLLLMEPVVTAPGEHTSDDVVTRKLVEAATAPALRVTPLRISELAPAGNVPLLIVTNMRSELLPVTGTIL